MTLERFVLAENLHHLERRLQVVDPDMRPRVELMVLAAARELAMFDAQVSGAAIAGRFTVGEAADAARAAALPQLQAQIAAAAVPTAVIDPQPGLRIAAANAAFLAATALPPEAIVGRSLFALFPDNPEDPAANGVANLYASLRRVAETGREHAMAVQRYDVRDAQGVFQERYWAPVNTPVPGEAGEVLFILHASTEQPHP